MNDDACALLWFQVTQGWEKAYTKLFLYSNHIVNSGYEVSVFIYLLVVRNNVLYIKERFLRLAPFKQLYFICTRHLAAQAWKMLFQENVIGGHRVHIQDMIWTPTTSEVHVLYTCTENEHHC